MVFLVIEWIPLSHAWCLYMEQLFRKRGEPFQQVSPFPTRVLFHLLSPAFLKVKSNCGVPKESKAQSFLISGFYCNKNLICGPFWRSHRFFIPAGKLERSFWQKKLAMSMTAKFRRHSSCTINRSLSKRLYARDCFRSFSFFNDRALVRIFRCHLAVVALSRCSKLCSIKATKVGQLSNPQEQFDWRNSHTAHHECFSVVTSTSESFLLAKQTQMHLHQQTPSSGELLKCAQR